MPTTNQAVNVYARDMRGLLSTKTSMGLFQICW